MTTSGDDTRAAVAGRATAAQRSPCRGGSGGRWATAVSALALRSLYALRGPARGNCHQNGARSHATCSCCWMHGIRNTETTLEESEFGDHNPSKRRIGVIIRKPAPAATGKWNKSNWTAAAQKTLDTAGFDDDAFARAPLDAAAALGADCGARERARALTVTAAAAASWAGPRAAESEPGPSGDPRPRVRVRATARVGHGCTATAAQAASGLHSNK